MREPTLVVGKITKAHGLRGEVNVVNLSDNPERFLPGASVFAQTDGRELKIRSVRPGGARLLVMFEGFEDRDGAESLHGTVLVVPYSMLPQPDEGEYWPHDLEGCSVVTRTGTVIGTLSEVIPGVAQDLWATTTPGGDEILIPAVREVVLEVNIESKTVTVAEVPGLTVPDLEDE